MLRTRSLLSTLLVVVCLAAIGRADEAGEKEARVLFEQGNALVDKGSYVEALEKFRAAYARWANPKILVNIGTTLRQLGRYAEAADTYDRWLRDPGADPKRRAEIEAALKELDAKIGKLTIVVKNGKARILVDAKDVGEAPPDLLVRVEPGAHTVVGDREGADAVSRTVAVAAGDARTIELDLAAHAPVAVAAPASPASTTSADALSGAEPPPTTHRGRFGLVARADVDLKSPGAVGVPAISYGLLAPLEIGLGALIGKTKGFEPSATIYLLSGYVSPRIVVAAPFFFIDGAHPGLRGGGGVQWDPSARIGFFVDVSAAYFPGAPAGYERTVVLASVGAQTRF